mgnify:CR=1 FL=1|jgi:hypothetical protein|tara:strand:+ start:543 stop:809 length:267 start_codon:yes stop_codon:yes gene_type:complete
MKQRITEKQWDELSDKEEDILYDFYGECVSECGWYHLNIGQLIEFLGDSWWYGYFDADKDGCIDVTNDEIELIDFLWEATKYKLNYDR